MNIILTDVPCELDDFFSPAKADAAQREWQAWYRRQVTRLGADAVRPTPTRRFPGRQHADIPSNQGWNR
jgi:hypothetical protein